MKSEKYRNNAALGFTIIELLVVIVVIGILATIVIVSYNSVVSKANDATLQVDVDGAAMLLEKYGARTHTYPQDPKLANDGKDLPASDGNTISYNVSSSGKDYCVAATRNGTAYRKSSMVGKVEVGDCSSVSFPLPVIVDGSKMQVIQTANCPTTRTRAVDARDNHTYWVQKLADGKCWMLTNLGYAGDGTNTYSDVIPTGSGSTGTLSGPDNAGAATFTLAKYYIPTGSNVTTEPTNPSTSINGTGQYGYLYNWCAAMGAQATAACANATTPTPVATTSICPAGWRLPVGNGAEFTTLNTAVNSGSTTSDSGLLNAPWLGQRSGYWNSGFGSQGTYGYYWSSTQFSATSGYNLLFSASKVNPANSSSKSVSFAVRCVAAV